MIKYASLLWTALQAIALLACTTSAGLAQSVQAPSEIVLAMVGNQAEASRFQPFIAYMRRSLGRAVTLRFGDCEDIIEGQLKGRFHVAEYCGASYFSRAILRGAKIEPFAIEVNVDGSTSYRSVFYVKEGSAYRNLEDLKGRTLALVRKDSTSGDLVPRYILQKAGIKPETFFAKVIYTGDHHGFHEPMRRGEIDVAASTDDTADLSTGRQQVDAKLDSAPSTDDLSGRKPAATREFRAILKSDPILNPPLTYLAGLPSDLKAKIRDAVLMIGDRDPAAFAAFLTASNRAIKPWTAIDLAAYKSTIEMMRAVDALKR